MTEELLNPAAVIGHNQPPMLSPFDAIKQEIEDLFGEAKNWADGEPITNQAMHDAVEKLYDGLHDAGKRADEMRVAEKKPFDDGAAEVQARYNPLVQPKKGKVAMGKDALGVLLATWRKKIADEKAEAARKAREEADAIAAAAAKAIQESAGNLAAREEAEELLKEAKAVDKQAKRADKAATTGLGLRTVWLCEISDEASALDWAFGKAPERFSELVLEMARAEVALGRRGLPGIRIWDEKRAA